jgi:glucose-6-phosphate 1-epimerase
MRIAGADEAGERTNESLPADEVRGLTEVDMSELIEALNDQFRIPGVAEVIADRGGLPAVWVEGKGGEATGTVYLHGAHVAAWRPSGFDEVLWLSGKSMWADEKPIRGGVPICFPWFGPRKDDPKAPAHGFARLRRWGLESITQGTDGVTVVLALSADEGTHASWGGDFMLRHRVTFGCELMMSLELTNTGTVELVAEEALHTYFAVSDVRQVRVKGLAGARYIDKTDGFKEKTQEGDVTITAETDRVYMATTAETVIEDPGKKRQIRVKKEESVNTVVWNPWVAKAKAIPDFGDEEWPGMICVETCNVAGNAVRVAPGQTRRMAARIGAEGM